VIRRNVGVSILLAASALTPAFAQATGSQPITAQEAINRILAANGVPPIAHTVDTIKAGDPQTPVTGIVTTFLDTYQVLQRAVADGKNLIVTHEPTFYNHLDDMTLLGSNDPVEAQKLAYIREHHLVVWRFHDAWHQHHPDGILEGMTEEIGWTPYQDKTEPHLFTLPATTVEQLVDSLHEKLGSRTMRIIGDPKMQVTHIALLPGASGLERQVKMLERDDVQVLVAGEASEWETVEYVRDAVAQGRRKALILLGHEVSEEGGMEYCATWLKGVFPGMPIEFVPAGQPFWPTPVTKK
jgi:putative NIF3 family GTP cyclohydrolase 1 type 2